MLTLFVIDWDLRSMLTRQLITCKMENAQHFYYWNNLHRTFREFYGLQKVKGMKNMLEYLGLPLKGRHHSGIDDAKNITNIVVHMIQAGCVFDLTSEKRYT